MNDQENSELLIELKKSIKKLEYEINKCKSLVERIESAKFTNPKSPDEEADKILIEYKEGKDDALTWLIEKSKLSLPNLILLFKKHGYDLPPKTTKKKIKEEVENLLIKQTAFIK